MTGPEARAIREAFGLSQRAFAALAGVTQQRVHAIEATGELRPGSAALVRAAAAKAKRQASARRRALTFPDRPPAETSLRDHDGIHRMLIWIAGDQLQWASCQTSGLTHIETGLEVDITDTVQIRFPSPPPIGTTIRSQRRAVRLAAILHHTPAFKDDRQPPKLSWQPPKGPPIVTDLDLDPDQLLSAT